MKCRVAVPLCAIRYCGTLNNRLKTRRVKQELRGARLMEQSKDPEQKAGSLGIGRITERLSFMSRVDEFENNYLEVYPIITDLIVASEQ